MERETYANMGGGIMVIHTVTVEEKAECWIVTILTVILCVGYYLDSDSIGLMVFGIVPTIMLMIPLIYPAFLLRKTLIMDEKGCIIRFFGKERYYAWEDEIYEPGYEESYFREKMKEWNVELEEVRMRDWKKK